MLPETNWGIGFRRRGAWAWAPVRVIVGGGSKWFLRDDSLINFYLGVFLAVGVIFWGGWELGAGGGLCRRGVFFGFVVGGGGVLGLSGLCVCVCVCVCGCVCVGVGTVGCVQIRELGRCARSLRRFILLVSFSDTLLVVSVLDIV